MMKKLTTIAVVLVIIGALALIKWQFFPVDPTSGSKVKKEGKTAASPVEVFVAHRQSFDEQILATGTALANEEAALVPEVPGKVTHLYFKEGAFVKKGTLLVKINDADLKAQLNKTELQLKLSVEKADRQKKLLEMNGVSQEGYDIALNEVNSLKADRDYLLAQVRKTEIRAPFDGVVGLRNVSEGSYVSPSTVIANIQQLTPIKIDFSIPEKYASVIHKGDELNLRTEGSDRVFKARVFAIDPKIDPSTRTLKLRALCYEHQNSIFPGAFVKVDMIKKSSNSLLIPTQALIPEMKGYKVFFYRDGKAVSASVQTGTRTDESVLITKGVQEGDTLITTGVMQLKNGDPVHIVDGKK